MPSPSQCGSVPQSASVRTRIDEGALSVGIVVEAVHISACINSLRAIKVRWELIS